MRAPALALVLIAAARVATAQPLQPTADVVPKGDPSYHLLAQYQARIVRADLGIIRSHFSPWRWITDASAARLFPGLKFAIVTWDQLAATGAERQHVSRAFGLQTTLAIDPVADTVVAELSGFGNFEAFGTLLVDRGIRLGSAADASLVWAAFCAIHVKGWAGYAIEQAGPDDWRLGRYSYDQTIASTGGFRTEVTRTQYMRVRTDPATGRVQSWEGVVETSNERKVKIEPREGSRS